MMDIEIIYNQNKEAKVGDEITCPTCRTKFVKLKSRQSFCGSRKDTKCKDKYWNGVRTMHNNGLKVERKTNKQETNTDKKYKSPKKTERKTNNIQKPLKKYSSKENWVKEQTPRMIRASAQATLDKIKEQRKGKKFRYIQVNPKTIIEVEV